MTKIIMLLCITLLSPVSYAADKQESEIELTPTMTLEHKLSNQISVQQSELTDLSKHYAAQQGQLITVNNDIYAINQNIKNLKERLRLETEVNVNLNELKDLQTEQLKQYKEMQNKLDQQETHFVQLQTTSAKLMQDIEQQTQYLQLIKKESKERTDKLTTDFQENSKEAKKQFLGLNDTLEENATFWLNLLVVSFFIIIFILFLLKMKMKNSNNDIEEQIAKSKQSLQEESINLDNKLIEILETQLKVQQVEISQPESINVSLEEIDHSLTLKVADEIVRMQKNLIRIDKGAKGVKALGKCIDRVRNNFLNNGYEIPDLLNKEFDHRMNLDVIRFIEDDGLPADKQVISKIIRPQVNFNGVLIQSAQVEVSQN